MNNESSDILVRARKALFQGFASLPPHEESIDWRAVQLAIDELAARLQDNLPYHHPLYVGQMLKPPHPAARMAYALAMELNPNNHALDGGRATSAMEKECVAAIGDMFGWQTPLGHLTSGGTMANFEALWISRELQPGKTIVASSQAHYTHERLSRVLGVPFRTIRCDSAGRMDLEALESALKTGEIGAVVATLGTTGLGAVDPLAEIAPLCRRHGVRVHVDAAYGGYFTLSDNLSPTARSAFDGLPLADSIVVDPHKHGLQPYGCGCVLFRDPTVGRFYRHESPYTYFTSAGLHLGEISLECSRPGAAAAALWTTMRVLPLERGGEFAAGLSRGRDAALQLYQKLGADDRFRPILSPELDIVVWALAADRASEASLLAQTLFEKAEARRLHLAKIRLPRALIPSGVVAEWDESDLVCLRACVMKPSHLDWLPEIWRRLVAPMEDVR